jgi:hypothetical protein
VRNGGGPPHWLLSHWELAVHDVPLGARQLPVAVLHEAQSVVLVHAAQVVPLQRKLAQSADTAHELPLVVCRLQMPPLHDISAQLVDAALQDAPAGK